MRKLTCALLMALAAAPLSAADVTVLTASRIPTMDAARPQVQAMAFDAEGNRLGMGGGYYDRTLACWHEHKLGPKPLGLAHDCQQVDAVPQEQWDVPLPQIITPSRCWQFA